MAIPRRKLRGPSALACLGKTKRGGVPREDIPKPRPERSEGCLANARQDRWRGRGASLTLGKTKNGGSAGQKAEAWSENCKKFKK